MRDADRPRGARQTRTRPGCHGEWCARFPTSRRPEQGSTARRRTAEDSLLPSTLSSSEPGRSAVVEATQTQGRRNQLALQRTRTREIGSWRYEGSVNMHWVLASQLVLSSQLAPGSQLIRIAKCAVRSSVHKLTLAPPRCRI